MSDSIRRLADSRYASRVLEAHPELARELSLPAPFTRGEIATALEGAGADDEAALMRRLRRLRSRVLLRVMARDLCALADLDEVCGRGLGGAAPPPCPPAASGGGGPATRPAHEDPSLAAGWGENELIVVAM